MVLDETEFSDFLSDLTKFWRDVNFLIRDDGSFITSTGELGKEFTKTYRTINPFVSETGGGEFFGYTSISSVPIIGNVIKYTEKQNWVKSWELMESPFWRFAAPIAIAYGISILTAGIITMISPSIGLLGNIATAKISEAGILGTGIGSKMTISQLVSNFVGSTYGNYIGKIPVNEYIKKVSQLEANKQIDEYNQAIKELKELENVVDTKNKLEIEKARKEIERKKQQIENEKNITTILTAGSIVSGIIMLSSMRG